MGTQSDSLVHERCPDCGQRVPRYHLEDHLECCDGQNGNAFDGVCPMCRSPYNEYITHLLECDGG
jgi:hypothetical protein